MGVIEMWIETTRFGEVEFRDHEVYTFPYGIPGFQEYKKFTLIALEDSPFYYLQSVEEGSLAFVTVDPFSFFPEYEFELPEQTEQELSLASIEDVRVLNIVSVQGSLESATINLVAPVILNSAARIAVQIILEGTGYTTRHSLKETVSLSGTKEEA
jgi:flagellar assembly factor FliW